MHKDQQRWGGVSTDTRSSQAQYVSRTALDTGREGRLLRPIRAPPSPGHAVQQGQPKRRSHAYQPGASQKEMRPRRECGQLDVAASPGNQGHRLDRRLERHISRHVGEALPALGRLDLPPRHIRSSRPLARSASLAAQRGEPAAPAVLASSGAARGVCCLPSSTPNPRASRSVPTSPCTAHTHISAEHESARRSPQRWPGGTAPAASRCT